MNRKEYLELLRDYVSQRFSRVETEDIIRDYEEFFADGLANGKTEMEVISGLGSPKTLVQQLVEELQPTKKQAAVQQLWQKLKLKGNRVIKKLTQKLQRKDVKKMSVTTRLLRFIAQMLAFGAAIIAFVIICFIVMNMIWTGIGAIALLIGGSYFIMANVSLGLVFFSGAFMCLGCFLIGIVITRVLASYILAYSKRLKTWWQYHVNQVPGGTNHE
ncbi:MAG: DUF1700 domain-containing protein [Culicoidibacterales bacterium]